MASKGTGMSFSRKSYRLTSDAEKSRVTGKGWHDRGGGGGDVLWVGGRRRKGQMQPGPRSMEHGIFHTPCSWDQFFADTHRKVRSVWLLF